MTRAPTGQDSYVPSSIGVTLSVLESPASPWSSPLPVFLAPVRLGRDVGGPYRRIRWSRAMVLRHRFKEGSGRDDRIHKPEAPAKGQHGISGQPSLAFLACKNASSEN